jgi:hypothetical protein
MKKYFPPLDQISREVLATGIAIILTAYLIAKVPPLKRLVQTYQLD